MQFAFGLGWQQARLLLQSLSELPPAVTSYHTVTSNPQQSHFVFKHRLHFSIVFTNNVGPGQAASLLQDICCSHHTSHIFYQLICLHPKLCPTQIVGCSLSCHYTRYYISIVFAKWIAQGWCRNFHMYESEFQGKSCQQQRRVVDDEPDNLTEASITGRWGCRGHPSQSHFSVTAD